MCLQVEDRNEQVGGKTTFIHTKGKERSLLAPNRSSCCTVTLQIIMRHCKETSKEAVMYFLNPYLVLYPGGGQ